MGGLKMLAMPRAMHRSMQIIPILSSLLNQPFVVRGWSWCSSCKIRIDPSFSFVVQRCGVYNQKNVLFPALQASQRGGVNQAACIRYPSDILTAP